MESDLQTGAEAHAEQALPPVDKAEDTPEPAAPVAPRMAEVKSLLLDIKARAHLAAHQLDVHGLGKAVSDLVHVLHQMM